MEQVRLIEKGAAANPKPADPPVLPLETLPSEWREERLLDDAGEKSLSATRVIHPGSGTNLSATISISS
jgi:hypothetical protein